MFKFNKFSRVIVCALSVVLMSISYSAEKKSLIPKKELTVPRLIDRQLTKTKISLADLPPTRCAPAPSSSLVVNVKDKGAKGNKINNDTKAIQAAIDQVASAGGGTVFVPDGTYKVDAIKGIGLKSNVTFRMSKDAVLKAIPNHSDGYNILRIQSASNVNVIGGTLKGERDQHLVPPTPESQYGMGLNILSSKHIVVEDVTARDCWGDGFYVGGSPVPTDIKFCSVTADNNRRQGMSVTSADGLVVQDSIFRRTNGTNPQAGIDLEPNPGNKIQDVQIIRSQFLDNVYVGLELYGNQPNAKILNVTIDNNILKGNDGGLAIKYAHGHRITNNSITDKWTGISLTGGSTKNTITGNTINVIGHGPGRDLINESSGNIITGNTFVK